MIKTGQVRAFMWLLIATANGAPIPSAVMTQYQNTLAQDGKKLEIATIMAQNCLKSGYERC